MKEAKCLLLLTRVKGAAGATPIDPNGVYRQQRATHIAVFHRPSPYVVHSRPQPRPNELLSRQSVQSGTEEVT